MVDDSHEDFRVAVDSLDATQGFIHSGFDAELCASMLCSGVTAGHADNILLLVEYLVKRNLKHESINCLSRSRLLSCVVIIQEL